MKSLRYPYLIVLAFILNINVNAQNVGINDDGRTPMNLAMLDVESTIKGFLPPRMTQARRNVISPIAGLMIYNNTSSKPNYYNGALWMNYDGTSAISIGDSFQGGIIVCIFQLDAPAYVAGETHGLITATGNQSDEMRWNYYSYLLVVGSGTALGTGSANTTAIITKFGNKGYATKIWRDYNSRGYNDWYLPSKDELNKLYLKSEVIGIFQQGYYWNSSEYDNLMAWGQSYYAGIPYNDLVKSFPNKVRSVRGF
ncbi:MAG: hypothetical protein WCM93_06975 [Bacteroidota bacterium]